MRTLTGLAANRWLWLALLAALAAVAGWLTEDGKMPAFIPSVVMRWGYDALSPTGQKDPQPLFDPLPAGYRIETVLAGWTPLGQYEMQRKRERLPLSLTLPEEAL